jgi:uncharacterized membrane protein required for colicin V production
MRGFFSFVFLTTMFIISSFIALDLIIHATSSMCSVFTATPESMLGSLLPMFLEGLAIWVIGYVSFTFFMDNVKKLGDAS